MRGVNKAIILGNVGNDPEVKYMSSGDAVANFTVATSEKWKDKNTGQMQEKTEWHRVTAYRKLAEIIQQYVKKGSKIYIEGKLQTRKWQDQSGADRYTTEIVASEMQMLDARSGGAVQQQALQEGRMGQAPGQAPPGNRLTNNPEAARSEKDIDMNDFHDDIPF